MKFIFKIPTFYKVNYGVDIEIDRFCENICSIANSGKYTSKVDRIDVIPVIIPEDLINEGKGKEFTKIELKYKLIALSRRIDFRRYTNAGIEEKKFLLTECLLKALEEVKKKICFNVEDFEKEIRKLLYQG